MAAPRRPGSGRRPATRARTTARVPAARAGSPRTPAPRATTAAGAGGPRALTTRAAVLGLVLCGLLVSAALPLREYLAQRAEIAAAEERNAAAQARVAELEGLERRLHDPAYVKAQARQHLQFVLPGETTYQLLPDPRAARPAPAAPPVGTAVSPESPAQEAPWYSQLYGTVRTADAR